MSKEQYEAVASVLLLRFARSYNPSGPAHGHNNQEARDVSIAISLHARSYDPAWYPPIKT